MLDRLRLIGFPLILRNVVASVTVASIISACGDGSNGEGGTNLQPQNQPPSTVSFDLAAQKEQITISWNNSDVNNESFDVCISLDPDLSPTNCMASPDSQLLIAQQSPVVVTSLENKELYFVSLLSVNSLGYNVDPLIKSAFTIGQGSWRTAAPFPSSGQRHSRGYSIGNIGYVAITSTNEHWAYNSNSDEWTQVSNLPNIDFQSPIITIDDSAYFLSGNEVWKYDSLTDTFSRMGDSPSESKRAAFSFVINGKAYVGGGYFNKTAFWEYDPGDDSWVSLSNLPSLQYVNNNNGENYPIEAFASVLGDKAYLGGTNMYFWEYDPVSMIWTKLNDIGSITYGATFRIDEKGAYYYASGRGLFYYSKKVGEFYKVASPPAFTCHPASFSANRNGFLVGGADHSNNVCNLDVINDLFVFEDK